MEVSMLKITGLMGILMVFGFCASLFSMNENGNLQANVLNAFMTDMQAEQENTDEEMQLNKTNEAFNVLKIQNYLENQVPSDIKKLTEAE
jgi:hypothetical protein